MSKRRVSIQVDFDVDDFLAGAAWGIGTVPERLMNEHLRDLVRRPVEEAAAAGSAPVWLDLVRVTVRSETERTS